MNRSAPIKRVKSLPQAPPRPDDAHKGTFGKVLIVAGHPGMSGAACLAGLGALRGGTGVRVGEHRHHGERPRIRRGRRAAAAAHDLPTL